MEWNVAQLLRRTYCRFILEVISRQIFFSFLKLICSLIFSDDQMEGGGIILPFETSPINFAQLCLRFFASSYPKTFIPDSEKLQAI